MIEAIIINNLSLPSMKNGQKNEREERTANICCCLLNIDSILFHLKQHMKKTEILSQFSADILFN